MTISIFVCFGSCSRIIGVTTCIAGRQVSDHIAVICAGRIQQEQRMARRRCVDDHELLAGLSHHAGERLKHGDLLGAWRPQVFLQEGLAGVIEILALGFEHMLAIALAFHVGIDPAHFESGHVRLDRHRKVRRRIGRGEMHRMTSGGEFHGDRRGDRGLSDSPLAEHHHQSVTVGLDLVDQPSERRQ